VSLSPNHGPRRDGLRPDLVVLHYTAMADPQAALRVLCSPAREVSAHYLIERTGRVHALVDEARRAWHAGVGSWGGHSDVNSRSIGIELDNDGQSPFVAPMMLALETLLAEILARWHIPPKGVIGHSDTAPGRKIDPGPRFDWARLARQGLAVGPLGPVRDSAGDCRDDEEHPPPRSVDPARFRAAAQRIGYDPEIPDATLLSAFRLRFRPGARGARDAEDLRIAEEIARRHPVDAPRPNA
jgi:N-acetylmuramoyl-L-alanine amidase